MLLKMDPWSWKKTFHVINICTTNGHTTHPIMGIWDVPIEIPLDKIKSLNNFIYILQLSKKLLINCIDSKQGPYIIVFDANKCMIIK
jgi:hypothetical protein